MERSATVTALDSGIGGARNSRSRLPSGDAVDITDLGSARLKLSYGDVFFFNLDPAEERAEPFPVSRFLLYTRLFSVFLSFLFLSFLVSFFFIHTVLFPLQPPRLIIVCLYPSSSIGFYKNSYR